MEKKTTKPGCLKILLLAGSRTDPASRFRILQFVEPLAAYGHEVTVRIPCPRRTWSSPFKGQLLHKVHSHSGSILRLASVLWNLRDASKYNVIMMNRDIVPEVGVTFVEPWLARRNSRLIFDFDDSIHLGPRGVKLRHILPLFAWITPGNPYLAQFAHEIHKNVSIWPTVVNTGQYTPRTNRKPGPPRIGWSGSTSTARSCLPLLEKPLRELAQTEEFEFIIVCNSDPGIKWAPVKTRFIPWTPETEVSRLQELDMGLMPLRDEPFERGKCGLKAIQYMGVGLPALVSPVGINREIVHDGQTGFHCNNDAEWVNSTRQLLRNPDLRQRMGEAARLRALSRYSVDSLLPKMLHVFKQVAGLQFTGK